VIFSDPTNDVAFKKLFDNQAKKEVLIHFLNTILDRTGKDMIKDVSYNDPNNLPEINKLKLSIVDVCATDESGKDYIIEVQVVKQNYYGLRAQYYSSLALSRQLDKKEKYAKLAPVIFVGVLDFDLFSGEHYLSHHLVLDKKTKFNELRLME
jgi:predicted transposase/invertase (TIGR01784 family)